MTKALIKTTGTALVAAQQIDEISQRAMELFKAPGSFEQELGVAQAITDMRAALTPEIMKPVMALMNTPLGFLTDRAPGRKDRSNNPVAPYGEDVIKEVFIEAKLRGFHVVGNELNVIAGRFYATKEGLKRKVKQHPGLTDLRYGFEVPRVVGDKGALVKSWAKWKLDGVDGELTQEFAVKGDSYATADSYLGKAERKLMAAILSRVAGINVPEGDATEQPAPIDVPSSTTTAPSFARVDATTTSGAMDMKTVTLPKVDDDLPMTPQDHLATFVEATGVSFDDFRTWCANTGHGKDQDSWTGFKDIPLDVCEKIQKDTPGLSKCVKLYGKANKA